MQVASTIPNAIALALPGIQVDPYVNGIAGGGDDTGAAAGPGDVANAFTPSFADVLGQALPPGTDEDLPAKTADFYPAPIVAPAPISPFNALRPQVPVPVPASPASKPNLPIAASGPVFVALEAPMARMDGAPLGPPNMPASPKPIERGIAELQTRGPKPSAAPEPAMPVTGPDPFASIALLTGQAMPAPAPIAFAAPTESMPPSTPPDLALKAPAPAHTPAINLPAPRAPAPLAPMPAPTDTVLDPALSAPSPSPPAPDHAASVPEVIGQVLSEMSAPFALISFKAAFKPAVAHAVTSQPVAPASQPVTPWPEGESTPDPVIAAMPGLASLPIAAAPPVAASVADPQGVIAPAPNPTDPDADPDWPDEPLIAPVLTAKLPDRPVRPERIDPAVPDQATEASLSANVLKIGAEAKEANGAGNEDGLDLQPVAATSPPQITDAPSQASATATPQTIPRLAADISRKSGGGSAQFGISLTPEGLGKVEVQISINPKGEVTATMVFDTPQAAAELRGRAAELQKSLEQAGFQVSEKGLSFSDTGRQGFGTAQHQAQQDNRQTPSQARAILLAAGSGGPTDLATAKPYTPSHFRSIDVRI